MALFPEAGPQPAREFRILGEALHEDLARPFQGGGGIGHPLGGVDEAGRPGLGVLAGVLQQAQGQGFQPGLPGQLGLGAALGLEGQIEVLQALLGVRGQDLGLEFGAQFALVLDAPQNQVAPFFQFPQIAQALLQQAQLDVVQAAGDLLAIAGDEGYRGALVEQTDGGGDLLRARRQFLADPIDDLPHLLSLSGERIRTRVRATAIVNRHDGLEFGQHLVTLGVGEPAGLLGRIAHLEGLDVPPHLAAALGAEGFDDGLGGLGVVGLHGAGS